MASTSSEFEQVFLTYRDIKEAHPSWTDKAIEDYLSFKRDLLLTSDIADNLQAQIDAINIEIDLIQIDIDNIEADIVDLKADVIDLQTRVGILETKVADLEALIPISVLTAVNYTVIGNAIITCTNAAQITITMPLAPIDQIKVSVKRTDGEVVVDGNGKFIDGDATVTLSRQYVGLTFVYNLAGDIWSII